MSTSQLIPFVKMHGAGNDYIYIDTFTQPMPAAPDKLAVAMSDRHCGVGGDGLILIHPATTADAAMQMFNADGSAAEMCGNGIRCVGKYLYEQHLCRKEQLTIATGRGLLNLKLTIADGKVQQVEVDMGTPILTAADIPTTIAGDPPVDVTLPLADFGFPDCKVTILSMGNPHCVLFVDEVTSELVKTLGPVIEHHPAFPQKTNVGFATVQSASEMILHVWERGSGATRACGTGACAAVVAGVITQRTARTVNCNMPGGILKVHYAESNQVYLTGNAVEVFQGEWRVSNTE